MTVAVSYTRRMNSADLTSFTRPDLSVNFLSNNELTSWEVNLRAIIELEILFRKRNYRLKYGRTLNTNWVSKQILWYLGRWQISRLCEFGPFNCLGVNRPYHLSFLAISGDFHIGTIKGFKEPTAFQSLIWLNNLPVSVMGGTSQLFSDDQSCINASTASVPGWRNLELNLGNLVL